MAAVRLGCLAGIFPWLAIVVYVVAPGSTSGATPPAFVYGIVSLFLFFNVFALSQWLQYKQVGRWRDYLVGERAHITLSLVAKSALAWQVFAGTPPPDGRDAHVAGPATILDCVDLLRSNSVGPEPSPRTYMAAAPDSAAKATAT